MITYHIAEGVQASKQKGWHLFSTPQGGKVITDEVLLSLWRYAHGRRLDEILAHFEAQEVDPDAARAGLACLAEAGLLCRDRKPQGRCFKELSGPLVSVVIVSHNSREWLDDCLTSIFSQTYSPLEVIVVDNASSDDSADRMMARHPGVIFLRLGKALPFAAAMNQGVSAAHGQYLLLLNPDTRLERDAVAWMIESAWSDPACAAVGAKLKFLWAPSFLNGLGNRVGLSSWGEDNGLGHLDLGQFDHWKELPSACYAAALIPRAAWESVGPADEAFRMYYEDAEWSYRARLLGFNIRAAPMAIVYHAFGGRSPTGEEKRLLPFKLRNVVYGRLCFAIKLADKSLCRFLRNCLLEDWISFAHALVRMDLATAAAYLRGWFDFFRNLPSLKIKRRFLKARRTLSDEKMFALQNEIPTALIWRGMPELSWSLIQQHYLPLIRSGRTRVMPEFERSERRPRLLIVSNDVVGVKMAGPGMRYLEIALALSNDLDVTLAVPSETTMAVSDLTLVSYSEDRPEGLQMLVEKSDVALISGYMVSKFPFLEQTFTRLVVDLYDPLVLENLHYYPDRPMKDQESLNEQTVSITNRLARIGDFFICGNERQRDYWIGVLTANGRVNPRNFSNDSTLNSLIDTVGIGFPDRRPTPRPLLRGLHPNIPANARIVLWGGGIWNWLDPLTLVKAWPQVISKHPEARLVFLGTCHPNPLVPRHEMAMRTQDLAAEIGEKDRSILFFEWLSYKDREALLCEADVGVTLHPVHVETRYSVRARVLDYLWAHLPVLITEGDVTSEWIRQHGCGHVVPPFDVDAVAQSLNALLDKPKTAWTPFFEPLKEILSWSRVVKPLRRYCLEGTYAPDRKKRLASPIGHQETGAMKLLALSWLVWKTDGTRALCHRIRRYVRWRIGHPEL